MDSITNSHHSHASGGAEGIEGVGGWVSEAAACKGLVARLPRLHRPAHDLGGSPSAPCPPSPHANPLPSPYSPPLPSPPPPALLPSPSSPPQVHTLHRVPNFLRPWEDGHDAESTSSAFVVRGAGGGGEERARDCVCVCV